MSAATTTPPDTVNSNPNIQPGQVPRAEEWNSWFTEKVDAANGWLTNPSVLGDLALGNPPTQPLHAASKAYVDGKLGGAGGGIPDAPSDGNWYCRLNGTWSPAPTTLSNNVNGDLVVSGSLRVGGNATIAGSLVLGLPVPGATGILRAQGGISTDSLVVSGAILTTLLKPLTIAGTPLVAASIPPNTVLQLFNPSGINTRVALVSYGGAPLLTFRQTNGTPDNPFSFGSPLSRIIGGINAQGSDTLDFVDGGRINMIAAEAWSPTAHGTYMAFSTTPIGTTATAEMLRITDKGALQFAATGPSISIGTGAPAMVAPAASLFLRTDGALGQQVYVNVDGAVNWQTMSPTGPFLPLSGGTLTGPINTVPNSFVLTSNPGVTTAPVNPGTPLILHGANASSLNIQFNAYGAAGGLGGTTSILGRGAQGIPGALMATVVDQQLIAFRGAGYGATSYGGARAALLINAAENYTDTAQGAYVVFQTTPIGSATIAERMRLTDAGALLIGQTAAVGTAKLQVTGGAAFDTVALNGPLVVGTAPQNALTVTPGATATTAIVVAATGANGPLTLSTSDSTTSGTGVITLQTGSTTFAGISGSIAITTGNSPFLTGAINLTTGNNSGTTPGGQINIKSGNATGSGTIGGSITLTTGNASAANAQGGNFTVALGSGGSGGSGGQFQVNGRGSTNNLGIIPGSTTASPITITASGSAGLQIGSASQGALTITPGTNSLSNAVVDVPGGANLQLNPNVVVGALNVGIGAVNQIQMMGASPTTAPAILATTGTGGLKFTNNLGFYNATPIAKPTVSGLKGGNAALTSLLAALVSYGLITDTTGA